MNSMVRIKKDRKIETMVLKCRRIKIKRSNSVACVPRRDVIPAPGRIKRSASESCLIPKEVLTVIKDFRAQMRKYLEMYLFGLSNTF